MKTVSRRRLLRGAGVGAAVVAAAAAAPVAHLISSRTNGSIYTFQAVVGLPLDRRVATYCSYVLEGHVDLAAGTGTLTKTMYAGDPEHMSQIVWPGFTRGIRVTSVRHNGSAVHLSAVVTDRSQLLPGERGEVEIEIDRAARTLRSEFLSSPATYAVTR